MTNKHREISLALALASAPLLSVALSPAALAQQGASVCGTVVDRSGAVVPGATATADGDNGQGRRAATESDGRFCVTGLAGGAYTLTVVAAGYKSARVTGVRVNSGQSANVNVTLERGEPMDNILVDS
jgi:uncharacterized low-complexity protein